MLNDDGSRPARLLESVPDALVVVDAGGLVSLVNRRAEELFGAARGDLTGRPVAGLLTGHGRGENADLLANPSGVPVELTVHGPAGEHVVEAILARPDGPGGCVVLALRDVTARRRESEELRALARRQTLVTELGRRALTGIDVGEVMDEAVRVLVADMGVEFANLLELLPDGRAVFRAGAGWREDVVGATTMELRPGTPAGQVIQTQVPVLIDNLPADDRFPGPSVAREHGVVSSLSVPIYGQARPLGVLAVHSARPRRFSDGDVHFVQAVANVVAAVMERAAQDEKLRERQMGRAEQMAAIGQVAAGVAHELRNPLTSVKGLVQVNLREAVARGLPAEDLAVIEQEVRRMERTLQTFLDFARPPRPDRRRLDLAEVVDRVYALVGGRAKKQGVTLRLLRPDVPAWVDGDQDQLQQLFLNLVLNALDALPRGGEVEAALRAPRDGAVELTVRDTGPGIAADVLPKMFETFVSSKETGLGLGLPVSKRIAEDHGGTLTAYNLPAGGACFVLRLPAPP
jgi:PAS domain S-box-containing protein